MLEFIKNILDPVQLIGYVGTACALMSYQCKKNKSYFLLQMGCSIAFSVQFILLNSMVGLLLNVFGILRGIFLSLGDRCRHIAYLILLEACFLGSCIATPLFFEEKWWMAGIMLIAQGVGTLAMWTRNGKTIRAAQVTVISPIWIVHNVYKASIGGIICECFNIGSVIVSFIRFKKSGFDKT